MFKRHSLAILGVLAATTTTNPDCKLQAAGTPTTPVCSELSPDAQASNGWRSVAAPQAAEGELYFRFQARPTADGLNGLLAIGPQQVDAFSDGAILIRFAPDGFVDVRDGSIYDRHLAFPYEAGVWYDVSVSADLQSRSYTVDIGRCGEQLKRLITNAEFRSDAPISSQLTHWAVWSSQAATLDVVTPFWGTTGSCQPSTCQSLARECGTAFDGCGGTLSCGGCGSGESCSNGACVGQSVPGVTGVPYGHVTPGDAGVNLGVGVVGPVPTTVYSGPRSPPAGTTIENVIINHELDITNSNITLRNVILNSANDFPIQIKGSNVTDTLIEYSEINCLTDGKVFDNVDAKRTVIRHNEVTGCQDFFFIEGPLETMLIENNYMHSLIGDSGAHSDGFQIGEFTTTTGLITIRGNYFEVNNSQIGKTDLLFATGDSRNDILMENNFFSRWGWQTLRCGGTASTCNIRNNIYDNAFQTLFLDQSSSPVGAYWHDIDNIATGLFECNRYEDGSFVEQEYVKDSGSGRVTYDTTGCPSYPPPPQ